MRASSRRTTELVRAQGAARTVVDTIGAGDTFGAAFLFPPNASGVSWMVPLVADERGFGQCCHAAAGLTVGIQGGPRWHTSDSRNHKPLRKHRK